MASINKAILIGHLGKDPEMRYTQDGRAVANFNIATTETWNDKNTGEKREQTEWHRIVAWGRLGEICGQYLSKGRQVFVEGRIQTREWEDQQGNRRWTTEIRASTVQFLGAKGDNFQQGGYAPPVSDPYASAPEPPGPGDAAYGSSGQSGPAPAQPKPQNQPAPSATPGVPPGPETDDDIPF
jgi:single-strand DNA-binding protein